MTTNVFTSQDDISTTMIISDGTGRHRALVIQVQETNAPDYKCVIHMLSRNDATRLRNALTEWLAVWAS